MYRVSVWFGCGYVEIRRRKSLEKALKDAAAAVMEYGETCAPLINGRPWHLCADLVEIVPGLYCLR